MLTTHQLLDLLADDPTTGRRGKIIAHRRYNLSSRNSSGYDKVDSTAQQRLLDALTAQPTWTMTSTLHPADKAKLTSPRSDAALNDSDRLWLSRLPIDPAGVTFDDAAEIAALHAAQHSHPSGGQPRPGQNRSDQRLLDSIWQPIKAHHDRRAVEAELANAQQSLPPIPHDAAQALADAVHREVDGLEADEAVGRARRMIQETDAGRQHKHAQRIADAQQRLDSLDSAKLDRSLLLRDTADLGRRTTLHGAA